MISGMTDLFAQSGVPFLDMAANQDELGTQLKAKLSEQFNRYGLELDQFSVQNVSLPEELQKVLDQRIGMNIAGDLNKLTQYNVAQSIPIAAANEGGAAECRCRPRGRRGNGSGDDGCAVAGDDTSGSACDRLGAEFGRGRPAGADRKLHGLMEKGILSPEEFAAKESRIAEKLELTRCP